MFVDTIVDSDIRMPQANTAPSADTLYGTYMDGRCKVTIFPPLNFSCNAEPSTDPHFFDYLMYEMDRMIVSDYTNIKDGEIPSQALMKL